jgi:hypothetical protein
MIKYLKVSLLIPFFLLMALKMTAQGQRYFLYIQSERAQPFYVRFDGKVLSSTEKGYLIIPKLPAGTANMKIGFASGDSPEQQFQIKISGSSDLGFLLKQDGNSGYNLYNITTFAVIRPSKKEEGLAAETPAPAETTVPKENTDTAPAPAPIASEPAMVVPKEVQQKAMMDSVRKDISNAFPANNTAGVTIAPPVAPKPARASNAFSDALDKVVKDDRVEEPNAEQMAGTEMIPAPPPDTTAAVQPAEGKKKGRRRRDREPLTAEEQQILADVMAEEHKGADTTVATAGSPVVVETPVAEAPVPEKKVKKARKKKEDDPAFINFQDDSTKTAVATEAATTTAVEVPAPSKKKRRRIDTETSEQPNNIVTDSTGYAVSDLHIDHESKKERRKKKEAAEDTPMDATAVNTLAPAEEPTNKSSLKMINSDCGKVMDEDTFRKVLRKFVAGKDDDGMIDIFRRQTKGYCLETTQIKTLVQLMGSDDGRYRLLDQAYPKVYDSEHFVSLESTLSDNYYKGRFKAMLHK